MSTLQPLHWLLFLFLFLFLLSNGIFNSGSAVQKRKSSEVTLKGQERVRVTPCAITGCCGVPAVSGRQPLGTASARQLTACPAKHLKKKGRRKEGREGTFWVDNFLKCNLTLSCFLRLWETYLYTLFSFLGPEFIPRADSNATE